MSKLITASVIFNGTTGVFYPNGETISLNCLQFAEASPKKAWLKRTNALGVAGGSMVTYLLSFDENDPEFDSNTLQGVAVQQNGALYLIDAVSVDNVLQTCDACCDAGSTSVTPFYTSGIPPFSIPVVQEFDIVREDDGTPDAFNRFSIDYMDYSISDPVIKSRVDGETTYTVFSFGQPVLVGDDYFD